MNKSLALLPLIVLLAACGTTDPYGKRADMERERQEKYVDRSIDKAAAPQVSKQKFIELIRVNKVLKLVNK